MRVPVFWSGLADYRVFRIPVLLRTGPQALLAFAEGRPHFSDHGSIDIVLRRSVNGGRTWGPVEALLDGSSLGSRRGTTVGNPVPIYVHERRELLMLFCSNFGSSTERAIRFGKVKPNAGRRVWLSRSFNLGRNWSQPVELTAQLKLPEWTWYAVGPGGALSLRNGSLVVPATHARRARRREIHGKYDHSHVLISHDVGATWSLGGVAATGSNEATVAELADGSVLLNARNLVKPGGARVLQRSEDGGASWGEMWTALREPRNAWFMPSGCHGSMVSARRGARLFYSGPDTNGTKRLNVSISVSDDGGRSWALAARVHVGPSGYSSLARLSARAGGRGKLGAQIELGVLYEGGARKQHYAERVDFVRWTVPV